VAASLESALSRFNSTIKAFRTFNCDYFLYALELAAVRTADVLEKSYEVRMPPNERNSLRLQRFRSNGFLARRELHFTSPRSARISFSNAARVSNGS
jgi:hypothetical protein